MSTIPTSMQIMSIVQQAKTISSLLRLKGHYQ